jgi:cbb3-type cytochrome oxidase subunit 3
MFIESESYVGSFKLILNQMRSDKILFWVSFIGSLIILLVGIKLKISETVSTSFIFSKNGGVGQGQINGTSTIVLGILILLFSFWNYKTYKKSQIDRQRRLDEEKASIVKNHSKNDLKLFLYNRKEFNKKYKIDK